jgi:hypothetical protein
MSTYRRTFSVAMVLRNGRTPFSARSNRKTCSTNAFRRNLNGGTTAARSGTKQSLEEHATRRVRGDHTREQLDRCFAAPQLATQRPCHPDHAWHCFQRLISLLEPHRLGLAHAATGRGLALPHDDVGVRGRQEMEQVRGNTERIASNEVVRSAPLSKDELRARESVARAMRIVGPPDAASARNLE